MYWQAWATKHVFIVNACINVKPQGQNPHYGAPKLVKSDQISPGVPSIYIENE